MCIRGPGRQSRSGEPDPPRLAYSPGVLAALCLEEEWWAGKEGCPYNTRGWAESEGSQPRQDLGQRANLACSVWRLSSGLLHRPTQGSWGLDCGNGRGSEG